MIRAIAMRAGSSTKHPALRFELSAVTIFVGPNNSGKSRTLLEIEQYIRNARTPVRAVLDSLEFEAWEKAELETVIESLRSAPGPNESQNAGYVFLSRMSAQHGAVQRINMHKESLLREALNPNVTRDQYAHFISLFTTKLDGRSRLELAREQPAGDLQGNPANTLAQLFADNSKREILRRIVFEALEKYLVIDPTNMGQLRLRLSSRPPDDESEERNWDSRAQSFHSKAYPVADASDGVKAFVGIMATLVAGSPRIILLDEPEAFLHPTLSAKLGKEVANSMQHTGGRMFVATHSASFLMGCVQAGAAVNIVRLTYDYEQASARLLSREKLTHLMRSPLLRSIGVLSALFYNVVVVTEGDADRAFYQEINERLLAAGDARGIPGCLFLNAQNKQTIWEIVRPLRELGIPAVGIVDIDIIKEGGTVWMKPLEGAFVPQLNHLALQAQRGELHRAFQATGMDMKRDGGISLLDEGGQEACRNLFGQMAEYGVFVVERGELEAWLPALGATRTKSKWLVEVFTTMGDDPSSDTYVRPQVGDVWEFLGSISRWARSPWRKGIPET